MKFAQNILMLLLLVIALPVFAAEEKQPATDAPAVANTEQQKAAPTMQADTQVMDTLMQQMEQTQMKMQATTDPAERKNLMRIHMQQMREGMRMMGMMGTQDPRRMPMGGQDMARQPATGQGMAMEGHDMKGMATDCPMNMPGGKMPMMDNKMGCCKTMGCCKMMESTCMMGSGCTMGHGCMMGHGGMMGPGGLMADTKMLEKKISKMMEMMKSMMKQQEMLLK